MAVVALWENIDVINESVLCENRKGKRGTISLFYYFIKNKTSESE